MHVLNGDVALEVETAGDPSAPPILLLHGITASMRTWTWLVPSLAERFHVLSLDFRGHGRSARAPGAYQPADYAADAVAVLEQLATQPAILLGHSLGGLTAATVAQQRPDLVRATMLEDPPLGTIGPEDEELVSSAVFDSFRLMREAIPAAQAAGLPAAAVAQLIAASPFAAGGTMGEHLLADAIGAIAEGFLELDVTVLDSVLDGTMQSALAPRQPIPVPTLLLTADPAMPDAVAVPAHVAVVVEHSPLVEMHVVEGAGHLIHDQIDTRDTFARLVGGFLDSV